MNIYDFDNTIYAGDSSIDFFKYCLRRNKRVLLVLPSFAGSALLYLAKLTTKETLKSRYFSFLKFFDDPEQLVEDFWEIHAKKIKHFYQKQHQSNDVVVSASPYFLLEPMAKKYHFKLFATEVDQHTGKLRSKNCHGKEKVRVLKRANIVACDKFYSDSLTDAPLASIAKQAYLVKGERICAWPK